jgi:uroporphyrinogen decarboxylase
MPTTTWEPLSREEVAQAVERRRPPRIPLIHAKWWGEGLWEQYGERLREFDRFPDDTLDTGVDPLNYQAMGLSWKLPQGGAHDNSAVLDDWAKLDEFIAKMPDPAKSTQFEQQIATARKASAEGRYQLFHMWNLFFERPWIIRGMANLMVDYYEHPEEVHRLHGALCDLYLGYLKVAARELKPDGFWTSDDLGHQHQLMMKPATFRTFLKPYYVRIGDLLKQQRMHWWLHSCGNNTPILGDLAEAGVNVFHPVQKHTMDERAVARDFGDRLTFLAGFDVQHTLREKTPDEVRAEVRFLIDTFDRPDGGMCLAAGNGIVGGTPFENIVAFIDEALRYGTEHRARMAR